MGARLLMNFELTPTSHTLADYRARGGYRAIEKALGEMTPQQVTAEVTASGIQGRGGANFSAGRKWSVVNLSDGQPHYLCANADEGEPGTFKDRWILENAPHLLLESMLIAAYALQVRHAFIYIRGEFDLPWRRISGALEEAYAAGYFGKPLFGTDFVCDLVVYRGAGSYVCGEASGLLSSLEGKRGYPRNRPPRLTVRGLYQRPTVVNNVETLSNIAGIINGGAEAFKATGTKKSPGTRLISISGHINKPGVYEIEPGGAFREFIFDTCGGVPGGRKVKAIIPGGISTKVVTGEEVDRLTLDNEALATVGSGMGSGGMVVIGEGTCMVRLLQVLLRFYHHESCGQCTPCREGMGWMHRIIDRIVAGGGRPEDLEQLKKISAWNDGNTICGMGDAAGYATVGILAKFSDEFEYFIAHGRSRHDGNLECRAST
ncbi:NADH-quinone oxidoreductase subunit NuoF [Usitatibacter palustris]|uniref:NADH-quinone oxidoreductase subunit 1 n=1 Tax=Usitatibacter palustris TaxID=2732487 RepID=A0A6M4H4X5_9PROT|nr:NADH-quinone oxidoreductase subunit NuoF [Usitatibacter palustris]QJR14215.1 NADH-quinone oxidoreductase subunit 1 [Usitatibacter palustris]